MKTVKEVSRVTGVSVRALHHYDAIGLLKPTRVTEAGYRLYDEEALRRLHSILLFRELGFALKDIRNILDSPDFDPMEALERQIGLLELQRQRLDRIIAHARKIQKTGGIVRGMSGSPIIQDNKIIGAVTHTVISDNTKGYGISIIKMLESME